MRFQVAYSRPEVLIMKKKIPDRKKREKCSKIIEFRSAPLRQNSLLVSGAE